MVNALKHDFKNEVCTRCGIGDPTPKKPETDQNDVYQIGSVGELYWFAGLVNGDTTKIDDNAFKGNKTVTKVTIGSNIKTIGKNAFSGATKLKKVTIGKHVTEIGANAFKGCSSLKCITLPGNVTKIGANAFSGCKKLKTITIKSTKLTSKTVSKNAFKGLTKETTIKVPKKKLAAYKKLFKSRGLSSKVKVKGY